MLVGSSVIVLITFFIIIMSFSKFVQTTSIERESIVLSNNIHRINDISRVAFANKSTNMNIIYHKMIDNISYNLEASVIVFDADGTIIAISGANSERYIGKKLNQKLCKDILGGKEIKKTGLLDDLFNGEPTLTVGAPLINNGIIYAGALISRPVPEIMGAYRQVVVKLIIVIFIALLFSFVLFYFISKKVTTPVKKINEAVNEFSKGNFEKRVEYISEDELGELSRNINNMADSLENLEKMRSGFVSDVSHELRTPMTTISGFVEGILDGTIDESERDRYLEIVLSESKRLSRLVTELLKLTRVQNNEIKLELGEFDIADLTFQTLFGFEKQINHNNLEIEINVPEEKINVVADKDAITQVLTNLLGNAVKFTPVGGKISIRIWKHQARAYVEIKNTGEGIEPEKLKFIWDRFYKTDKARTSDNGGFGLGLCIVKSIIDKHNQKIWAESVLNSHTLFAFSLKLA